MSAHPATPHLNIRGIYGDEINHSNGYRLVCRDCGKLLNGPASTAINNPTTREDE